MLSVIRNFLTVRNADMTEEHAYRRLSPYMRLIGEFAPEAYETYRTYPHRSVHRRTTAANVVNDEIWAAVIRTFDGVSGVKVVPHDQLRFLGIEDERGEVDILLWFKKVNSRRIPRIYPTTRARRIMSGRNLELFDRATILVVGYFLNRDLTKVKRVSISEPFTRKPGWFIDLDLPEAMDDGVVSIQSGKPLAGTGRKIVVHRVKQEKLAE